MKFPYTSLKSTKPNLGLIVLQTDETIEQDFRRYFPPEIANLHITRVPSGVEVTRDTLAEMSDNLPTAASLLPQAMRFDVVGYGCTSGTSVIGPKKIAKLVKSACNTAQVTEPVSGLIAACHALQLKNLAFLTPYIESVSQGLRDVLAVQTISTPAFGSFEEARDAEVARIDRQSIWDAAITLAKASETDGLFMSCTNLRTLDVIAELEETLQKPVLSSNLVLAWHMGRLAGITPAFTSRLIAT